MIHYLINGNLDKLPLSFIIMERGVGCENVLTVAR